MHYILTIILVRVDLYILIVLFKHVVDAAEDDVAPEEGEDDGAGEQEVEESDLDLSKPEGEAGTERSRRSENIFISDV